MSTENPKSKKPAAARVYLVTDAQGKPRLVRATSASTAVAHVYGDAGLVAIPGQEKLIELASSGVKVEVATKEPTDQASLPLGSPAAADAGAASGTTAA